MQKLKNERRYKNGNSNRIGQKCPIFKINFCRDFKDDKISFQIPHPREDLTKEVVEAAMNVIIETNIFEKKRVQARTKVSAEIIERTVHTTDFDISA